MKRMTRRAFAATAASSAIAVAAGPPRRLPIVIFWLEGGASPWDTLCPLDNPLEEYRGPFDRIATCIPGVSVCESFPRIARLLKHGAFVRNLVSGSNDHFVSSGNLLQRDGQTLGTRAGANHARGGVPYALVYPKGNYSPDGSHKAEESYRINWDPKTKRFPPPKPPKDPGALAGRRALLRSLDGDFSGSGFGPPALARKHWELALDLTLGGGTFAKCFQLPIKDVVRYGAGQVGQAALLASRLVRAGTGIVTVHHGLGMGWDTHSGTEKRIPVLGAPLDLALPALVEDGERHGYVTVCVSEFGRSALMDPSGGRKHDQTHWMLGYGGGFGKGIVVGDYDAQGQSKGPPPMNDVVANTWLRAAGAELPPREKMIEGMLA